MYYKLNPVENFSMRNAEITIELFLTIVLFRVLDNFIALKKVKQFLFIAATSLNSYISYFEPVYFDSSNIKSQLESHRVKRSLGTNTVNLDFKAQNR